MRLIHIEVIRMLKVITILMLVFSAFPAAAFAQNIPKLAFLNFVNKTQYKQMAPEKIFSELLLSELVNFQEIYIVEQRILDESLEAQNRLNKSSSSMEKATDSGDFAFLIESQQRKEVSQTVKGDFLPLEDIKFLGEKYGVDYILHGTFDFIGSKKEIKTDLVPIIGVEKTKFSVLALGTVRIIDVSNGEVVWAYRDKGVANDRYYSSNAAKYGTTGFNTAMIDEAMTKMTQNIAKQLNACLKDKSLVLTGK